MIYWDKRKKRWSYLKKGNNELVWGIEAKKLAAVSSINSELSIPVKVIDNKIGPLVGVLASYHEKKQFTGNIKLFLSLQRELAKTGGVLFIFTLQGVKKSYISGYVYNNRTKKWSKSTFPLPDIVYNRIGKRSEEKSKAFQKLTLFLKEKNIPFFNPHFFNKRNVIATLHKNPTLKKYLPYTMNFSTINHLHYLQQSFSKAYVKPVNGSKGKGIFTLSFFKTNIVLQTQTETKSFFSVPSCWEFVQQLIDKNEFIAQEAIKLNTHLNQKFDLRIHCHKDRKYWNISGIGVRIARNNNITTHVPHGGKIAELSELSVPVHYEKLQRITNTVGEVLQQRYGLIGEFSMDVGISESGHYYIFEVNAKPMRFDEQEIEQARINKLVHTVYDLTKFH
jgi:hypothetical protein